MNFFEIDRFTFSFSCCKTDRLGVVWNIWCREIVKSVNLRIRISLSLAIERLSSWLFLYQFWMIYNVATQWFWVEDFRRHWNEELKLRQSAFYTYKIINEDTSKRTALCFCFVSVLKVLKHYFFFTFSLTWNRKKRLDLIYEIGILIRRYDCLLLDLHRAYYMYRIYYIYRSRKPQYIYKKGKLSLKALF